MKNKSDEELYGGMSPDEDVLTEEEKAELIREAEAENIKRLNLVNKEVNFHGFI